MYRTHAQSRALEEQFVRSGLPYTIAGGTRFYERREVKDVMAYLRLLYNPYDTVSFERILNTPPRGIGAKTAERLMAWAADLGLAPLLALDHLARGEQDREEGGSLLPDVPSPFDRRSTNALLDFQRLFDSLRAELTTSNLPMLIGSILERTGYEAYIKDDTMEGLERWGNVIELQNVSAQYENLSAEQGLLEFLESTALMSDADQLPPEEQDVVTMMTLHTAKGLEFPVVFMPGFEENILPHSRSVESEEEVAEERRLAYVGITRAKERLYLTHVFQRTRWGGSETSAPSRFLKELPRTTFHVSGERSKKSVLGTRRAPTHTTARNDNDAVWTRTARPRKREKPASTAAFRPGDKVRHGTFGVGTVVSSKPSGSDEEVVVAFPDRGTKRLMASFAGLEKV